MQLCQPHWEALKQRIDDRCLSHLISPNGSAAAQRMAIELAAASRGEKAPRESYDPLMNAYWAVLGNSMMTIEKAGGSPLYNLSDGPEDPVDVTRYGADKSGRTWPKCPLCYINQIHEFTCRETNCALDRTKGYDFFLDRAADDQVKIAQDLGLVGKPS